ncbi:MAG: acetyl-CoA carboxylase, biotin carboxyl carrier protein [Alphaproteobacteria bacterium CG_4_10_14_0_8_um_filter_53_9]|nr:MAG: acetyl-CoA carboxylase, biotin carboxyl carrier protein [Alphaproteobacteria bacterium CG_4_10_14_0_8_um_filter_53_9]
MSKPKQPTGALSLKTFEDLTNLNTWLEATTLSEVTIEQNDTKISLKRYSSTAYTAAAAPAPGPAAASTPVPPPSSPQKPAAGTFTSPMVGTFYTASTPENPPFVKVGDSIKKGQVLCIIEAMKTMNQIESDRDGTLTEAFVSNATPVEFGEPLFVIS